MAVTQKIRARIEAAIDAAEQAAMSQEPADEQRARGLIRGLVEDGYGEGFEFTSWSEVSERLLGWNEAIIRLADAVLDAYKARSRFLEPPLAFEIAATWKRYGFDEAAIAAWLAAGGTELEAADAASMRLYGMTPEHAKRVTTGSRRTLAQRVALNQADAASAVHALIDDLVTSKKLDLHVDVEPSGAIVLSSRLDERGSSTTKVYSVDDALVFVDALSAG